jgi:membrane protein
MFFKRFWLFLKETYDGTFHSQIPTQAAALSYSTLMALGPLVAVAIMASSFLLKDDSEGAIANLFFELIAFIAPSTSQYDFHTTSGTAINPQIVEFVHHVIKSARSGTLGVVGGIALLAVALLLIVSIENALNAIWRIDQGRSWTDRLVTYWTVLTLGGLLALSAGTLGVLGNFTHAMNDFFGGNMPGFFQKNALSFTTYSLIACLLWGFYRLMPHTSVKSLPAWGGSILTTCCLFLNNRLSSLYVSKVIQSESLYGSIGIIPVLMFGLYVFWFLILVGGQVSYSLQMISSMSIRKKKVLQ